MAFHYILANLLAAADGAVGVLFLDEGGETVDVVCSDFTPYQMRVIGAYFGIYLRQLERTCRGAMGPPRLVHVEREGLHVHALALPDGYYLVLVQRRPGQVAAARLQLERAGEILRREAFGS
jgi:hypothetical protein